MFENSVIVKNVISNITNNQFSSSCIVGPSGSGKSFLLNTIREEIEKKEVIVILLRGDSDRKEEKFYPLQTFIETKRKISKKGRKVVLESITGIPYVGKSLKVIFEDIDFKNLITDIHLADTQVFKEHKEFSVHLISHYNKGHKVVILCDDIDDFDAHTINYLDRIQEEFVVKGLNFHLSYLSSYSTDRLNQEVIRLGVKDQSNYRLSLPKKEEISPILKFFGLKISLKKEELDTIYSCTGGHLHLLKIISAYLNGDNGDEGNLFFGNNLVTKLIDYRLKCSTNYEKSKRVLNTIAGIGKYATKYELYCLLNEDLDVSETLKSIVALDFVSIKDNYLTFSHDIIKDYTANYKTKDKISFYQKLAICLVKLTPGNYSRRAIIESYADNFEVSDTCWALYAIQRMREGAFDEIIEIKSKLSSNLSKSIAIFLEQIRECYKLSFQGRIYEALEILSCITNVLPKELIAEKVHIECACLLKSLDAINAKDAYDKVCFWSEIKNTEPEIWHRLMLLKIHAAHELNLHDIAKKTEQEIVFFFSDRINYDLSAQKIINRLNIYSDLLYSPQIAHKKLLAVSNELEKCISKEQYEFLIDYYIAQCNLSGNSLIIANYEESFKAAFIAYNLINKYSQIKFPHIEACLNNLYLSSYFSEKISLTEITKKYKDILEFTKDNEDISLLKNNYAGLIFLNGQTQEAIDILKQNESLINISETDSYYFYYNQVNLALLEFLNGNNNTSLQILESLADIVNEVIPKLAKYYEKHYDLLKSYISSNNDNSYNSITLYFDHQAKAFLSSIWDRYKLVFLFSDLQIWTLI
nr:ATP-binding protein [uncultured Draconibacterium sp.]